MVLLLDRAPIDEVVVGFVLDKPIGPNAVEVGRYWATRGDLFTQHEIHEPILSDASTVSFPGPVRVWLINVDGTRLVQLQEDRFHANWRRRGDSLYPGFTREGGVMHYALDEFARYQALCKELRGDQPNAVRVEMAKIDLLIEGKHWNAMPDVIAMVPALSFTKDVMEHLGPVVILRWEETLDDITITVSLSAARMKSEPDRKAFRFEFRGIQPARVDLAGQLTNLNGILNRAFYRLIPKAEGRFK